MSHSERLNANWDAWHQVMSNITSLLERRDGRSAINEVDSFLLGDIAPEVQSDALGMRADLKGELGDLEGAKKDLVAARLLIGPSYMRYVHELSLGSISHRQQNISEAVSWYRTAMRTCLETESVSGGTAVRLFLGAAGEHIAPDDKELCIRTISRSWEVLGLPGKPETDFSQAIEIIKNAEGQATKRGDVEPG